MTKPTKWHVRPVKTQLSLGIHPVWSEALLSTWRKLGSLATHWGHNEDWSAWADTQADLSSLGAQSFCWFCHDVAHIMSMMYHTFLLHIAPYFSVLNSSSSPSSLLHFSLHNNVTTEGTIRSALTYFSLSWRIANLTNWYVHSRNTRIILHVQRVFAVGMKKCWVLGHPVPRNDWWDLVDVQADLSLPSVIMWLSFNTVAILWLN